MVTGHGCGFSAMPRSSSELGSELINFSAVTIRYWFLSGKDWPRETKSFLAERRAMETNQAVFTDGCSR